MTKEKLAQLLDVEYEDGKFVYTCYGFDDVLSKNDYSTEIAILSGEYDNYNTWDAEVEYHWDDYDEETLKDIIEYCVKNKLELYDEIMTNENTILENGDIYFMHPDGDHMKLVDELDELVYSSEAEYLSANEERIESCGFNRIASE